MKTSRNAPCPCGSGKKYKRCCMDSVAKQHSEVLDDFEQTIAMNPHLTIDELNAVMQHKMQERNTRPNPDFCGLSPTQMTNWLYAPLEALDWVTISTPSEFSASPVMRYLTLILDEATQNNGSFKATSKGNLPTKLVKQASDLLPEFAVAQHKQHISINPFTGSIEDKFNALHYTRVLAEIAGIIYRRSGRYHIKKEAQKLYQNQGIQAFFNPMLDAAIHRYNWSYLDGFEQDVELRTFWLFMLWRLQSHAKVDQLITEVATAFPELLDQFALDHYLSPTKMLGVLIQVRFIEHFLQFWGFVAAAPKQLLIHNNEAQKVDIQPLLTAVFKFHV